MTPSDFTEWWRAHSAMFPATHQWVQKNGGVDLLRRWRDVLQRVDLADALEATARMARGDDEAPSAYEREFTPAFVHTIASRLLSARIEDQKQAERRAEAAAARRGQAFPAGQVFAELARLMSSAEEGGAGLSHAAAVARMREKYAPADGGSMRDQRTFYCPLCLDSGTVTVWHPMAMRQAAAGEAVQLRRCMTACNKCRLGEAKHEDRKVKSGRTIVGLPYFDEHRMSRYDELMSLVDNHAALTEFMTRPRAFVRDTEFAEWNK